MTRLSNLALKKLGTNKIVKSSSRADKMVVDSSKGRKVVKSQKTLKPKKFIKAIGLK